MRDASVLLTLIGYSEAKHGFRVDEIASGRFGLGLIGGGLRNSGADFRAPNVEADEQPRP